MMGPLRLSGLSRPNRPTSGRYRNLLSVPHFISVSSATHLSRSTSTHLTLLNSNRRWSRQFSADVTSIQVNSTQVTQLRSTQLHSPHAPHHNISTPLPHHSQFLLSIFASQMGEVFICERELMSKEGTLLGSDLLASSSPSDLREKIDSELAAVPRRAVAAASAESTESEGRVSISIQ